MTRSAIATSLLEAIRAHRARTGVITVVDTRNAIASPRPHVVRLGAPRQLTEEDALVG